VENPAPKLTRRRATKIKSIKRSKPLGLDEVVLFLGALPNRVSLRDGAFVTGETLHDLYFVWFRTGWRPSEIVAPRFEWLNFTNETVELRLARSPRYGGLEAPPKQGERIVPCSSDPEIFKVFERRRNASLATGSREYVFTDSRGRPLSQDWLHKRIWKPTLRIAGISERDQYSIRDTFITLALSAGEDPGWVAAVCGNSEEMIFKHYRQWMPALDRSDGTRIARAFQDRMGTKMGTKRGSRSQARENTGEKSGGGGNRTPVRKRSTGSHYTLSSRFMSPARRP